ncbi:hypothetical protein BKA67DRAFT_536293 [Truncatella angustata]|uniref:Uncharacterized protein n=1 Tax=Truncatella angustata TaxID=152316 RepID=A0A9P8UI09_9PEZI|nr:uncharacterized protein BKA67DRAFT_536293 [Truncatella angustata]KAH6652557.1 hypothetical protein BKA67DRAFT_536293 [Truncatella angustata]
MVCTWYSYGTDHQEILGHKASRCFQAIIHYTAQFSITKSRNLRSMLKAAKLGYADVLYCTNSQQHQRQVSLPVSTASCKVSLAKANDGVISCNHNADDAEPRSFPAAGESKLIFVTIESASFPSQKMQSRRPVQLTSINLPIQSLEAADLDMA